MKNEGMEIGFHGYNHYWLNKISKKEQKIDIVKSLNSLRSIVTKKDMLIFCYPYGGYNAHTLDILKENEFKAALTVKVEE